MNHFDIVYYLISIICSIASAIVLGFASKAINEFKGYDGGFGWGFFLGVIGLIVVLAKQTCLSEEVCPVDISATTPNKTVSGNPQTAGQITCPKCGASQFNNRKTCFKCGADLN